MHIAWMHGWVWGLNALKLWDVLAACTLHPIPPHRTITRATERDSRSFGIGLYCSRSAITPCGVFLLAYLGLWVLAAACSHRYNRLYSDWLGHACDEVDSSVKVDEGGRKQEIHCWQVQVVEARILRKREYRYRV